MDFNYIDNTYIYLRNRTFYTNSNIEKMLRICRDCVNLINNTTNPDVFFNRYKLLISILNELIPIEKNLSLTGTKPSEFKKQLINKEIYTVNDFFDRYFKRLNLETNSLKKINSKENKIKKYMSSIDNYKTNLTITNIHYYQNHFNNIIDTYGFKIKKYGFIFCNNCGKQIEEYSKFCIYCGKKNSNTTYFHEFQEDNYNDSYTTNYDFNEIDYETSKMIENKYRTIIDKHYRLLEKINMTYTVANNLYLPNSPEMQKVIDLCLQDISLAPKFLEYNIQEAKLYNRNLDDWLPVYPSFKRLAIIYEKQGKLNEAIDICKYAIQLGFYKDGTAGQMPGRLARLIKKARNKNEQLN